MDYRTIKRGMFDYGFALVLCIVILACVTGFLRANLSVPYLYSDDALYELSIIKGAMEHGGFLSNNLLGAPFGQSLHDYYASGIIQILLFKLLSLFGSNCFVVLNAFFLISFPITAMTSLYVMKRLGISTAQAIFGSLLFTFLPGHFYRFGHPYVLSYFIIPLIVLLLIWIYTDVPIFFEHLPGSRTRKLNLFSFHSIAAAIICCLIACDFIYTCYFSLVFIFFMGIAAGVRHRSKYPIITSFVLIAIILLALFIAFTPRLIYVYQHGKNPAASARTPSESNEYALKIGELLLPMRGHRIPVFKRINDEYNEGGLNEVMSSAMGICASIGFLYLLAHLIIARNAPKNEILTGLAIVNIIAVLYCTGGGLGSLVAYFVTPTFRGLNRVSFYVAFVSICALVILLDKIWGRLSRKGDRYIYICALCAMGVIGLMDQTSSRFNYGVRHKEIEAEYFNDQQFATRMESLLVKDSMVMQLPLTGFPEYGPRFRMRDYSHLKPYLHSHRLRFSYGAMKGRRESEWHAGVNEKSGQEIYRTAMAMGFKGIYLDRFGFENSSEIEGQISEAAKSQPIMDGRQRYLFWKIGD